MQTVKQIEQEFTLDPTEEKRLAWQEAQKLYRNVSIVKAENSRFLKSQKHYEMGEQVGHMLAMIARNQEGPSGIAAIKDIKDVLVYDTESIQSTFMDFYTRIYESDISNKINQSK